MATNVENSHSLPLPDQEVVWNGTLVFKVASVSPREMENWVRMVARLSGQRVDWYDSGYKLVRVIGDVRLVKSWMVILMPILDRAQRRSLDRLGLQRLSTADHRCFV
jgi:hypothetical protein